MERAGRSGWWRGGAGVLLGLVLASTAAGAEERFHFGTTELTLAGGYSFSHQTFDVESVDTFQLLPHLGVFLSDEHGPPGLRGNFELIAEPSLVHFDSRSSSDTVGGLSALGRWVFATDWIVRPYVEAGLGILAGKVNLRQTDCDLNYVIEGGPGLLVLASERVAVTAGYRFQHISNGGGCDKNLGLNSSLFTVGVTYFFP